MNATVMNRFSSITEFSTELSRMVSSLEESIQALERAVFPTGRSGPGGGGRLAEIEKRIEELKQDVSQKLRTMEETNAKKLTEVIDVLGELRKFVEELKLPETVNKGRAAMTAGAMERHA